ncbi:Major Facilitator Superfamily protein [Lentzea fradiae]|uniref:Major Facilitator Superfamily protein n=1 Tax=Lentzea fradiae TaxID=200378 RepID=A0A1G7XGS4_9PSEU|nr:MFS transporter [Lentzea fradiae]SDG83412.1 Major Facilitator Superfamily protein [Lentzea fradiae]
MDTTLSTHAPPARPPHTRWNPRLAGQIAALLLANVAADSVIVMPLFVLPQMLEHFGTTQSAWLGSTAMLAGAMWAPLFGKSADIHGKRRMLTIALLVACCGAVVCLVAPNLWVFVLGRMVQGAAVAAVFLTVSLVRDLCTPRVAMPAVGAVTTCAGIVGIASTTSVEPLVARFGFQVVFVASAVFSVVAVVCIRAFVPESPVRTPGRVDVGGTLLLGGVVAVLGYVSLGSDLGWLSAGALTLLTAGVVALVRWYLVSSRVPEPVVDVRNLGRPMVLTLLVVVLATGAGQSMDQLLSLIAQVSADQGLGYGLDAQGSLALLFGLPALGIMAGGLGSGWLAARTDPAVALASGVVVGTAGAFGMFLGASSFPLAVFFAVMLNLSMGSLLASGFNMASVLTAPDRQGVTASVVSVMSAIGSVGVSFAGAAVLSGTRVESGGTTVNSATGVYSYIATSAGLFVTASVLAFLLLAHRRADRPQGTD